MVMTKEKLDGAAFMLNEIKGRLNIIGDDILMDLVDKLNAQGDIQEKEFEDEQRKKNNK